MDFHVLTPSGMAHILSTDLEGNMSIHTPRNYADIAQARKAAILTGAPLRPKGACHMCAFCLPPGALWCSTLCAQDYEREKIELLKP